MGSKPDAMTATYKSGELAKKYGNYLVPSAKVLVGKGKTDLVTAVGAQTESIRVSLNIKNASSASITITDIYDLQKRSIKDKVKNTLCLGETIIVELGYGSDREDIFHGFIFERSIEFGDIPTMHITALEVKRLMHENTRKEEKLTGKNENDIFEKIMEKYKNLNLEVVTDQPVMTVPGFLTQNCSDLMMIKTLCEQSNKFFLVCGSKVYFTKKMETAAVAPLTWGLDILSFSQRTSYMNIDIEVRGNITGNPQKQVETSTVSSDGNAKKILQEKLQQILFLPDVNSTEELQARADYEKNALEEKKNAGGGTCIGLPVLVPGRYVKITGIDSDIDGEYYLQSVNHSFGGSGYTTDFTLGGKRG